MYSVAGDPDPREKGMKSKIIFSDRINIST